MYVFILFSEKDSPPPPPPDVAQNDLMMRLGLLLGDRSPAAANSYGDGDQSASDIMNNLGEERPWSGPSRYNKSDRSGSMPDRYTGQNGPDWSASGINGRFTSHERSSSTPEKHTYPSSEDMYTTVSSVGTSGECTPDRGMSDTSPISTLTGQFLLQS